MKKSIQLFFCLGIFVALIDKTYAIPPPDFIFSVGSQLIQIFALVFIFVSTFFASFYQFIKVMFRKINIPKWVLILVGLSILAGSFGLAYWYDQYQQKKAYQEWEAQSEANNESPKEEVEIFNDSLEVIEPKIEELGEGSVETQDEYVEFIENFYQDLEDKKYKEVYEVGTKKHNYETFVSLYKNVEDIEVNSIVENVAQDYDFNVILDENGYLTTYNVNMVLGKNELDNIFIRRSSSEEIVSIPKVIEGDTSAAYISNTNFKKLIDSGSEVFVLDAREDEEYNIGYFPGSTHIRKADLQDGQWSNLPKDTEIYVLCWSGIRGKEVADFLVSKGLKAIYLEEGADSWVTFGGDWIGEIKFSSFYKDERYRKLITYEGVITETNNGTILVDAREKDRYDTWHIPNSVNISVINTPTRELEDVLSTLPVNSRVITVCDDVVNCFDARVTGVRLEGKGHTFLGRYNKPWEYRGRN